MNFQEELDILKQDLSHIHILVIGDVMIDRYVVGTASRISPEAPVPVILWKRTEDKLGGASNVVANLKSMGVKVSLVGLTGKDSDAILLKSLLTKIGCDQIELVMDSSRPTTIKKRIVVELHQIARIDYEDITEIQEEIQIECLQRIERILIESNVDVIILQDYNKGFLHKAWIGKILELASRYKVKTAVDPKKSHFFDFKGVDLFKPNLKEALQMIDSENKELNQVGDLATYIKNKIACNKIMITLASEGLWMTTDQVHQRFETRPRKVADVSGAGDTVISLAAICMACSLSDVFIASCCNAGGGQVCEKFGVVPVIKDELIRELEA